MAKLMNILEDKINAQGIVTYLPDRYKNIDIRVFDELESTNTYIKSIAKGISSGSPVIVIADSQTGGRGRLGRSFFSPRGTGIYMSIRLSPRINPASAVSLTSVAAVAVCEAIEMFLLETENHGLNQGVAQGANGANGVAPWTTPGIKWVNDIYYNGRKCCGILAEAVFNANVAGNADVNVNVNENSYYMVVGIGINVYEPKGGFPEEIKDVAGSILCDDDCCDIKCDGYRNKISAGVIERFLDYYNMLITDSPDFEHIMEIYKQKSIVLGKMVNVMENGRARRGRALDISREGHLLVEYENGERQRLNTGEISLAL